MTVKKLQIVDN